MQPVLRNRLATKFLWLLLTLALLLPSISATTRPLPQVTPQEAKSKLPPRQYIPSRNYDTQHIKLDLRFDWEREQALGTATITFASLANDLRQVEFDAAN